ncbi:hypothetical protein LVJ94_43625 [Pendulispora rubella]|uniref:SH3 domain-containing protein n=1 Tax=Pendulispora rubella TaxID=2741070 RepID=A0ABZ2KYX1_9BACT
MILPALALTVALVVQNQVPLRAASHANAPRQTTLASGDWLEVRGERQGYLQVYDHRHERAGYVHPSMVRSYTVEESTAPKLAALVDYLRDAPGQESLGIGYVALYLRAAPATQVGADAFDALGTMAERLGVRASERVVKTGDAVLAAQLEAAESYGVHFVRFEREGQTRVCYDGEAYRRVLALGGSGRARVRAALGLTDPDCADPSLGASAALTLAKWRAGVLDTVDPTKLDAGVPAHERARLRLRRAAVQAELAYSAARAGERALAKQASDAAKREFLTADRTALADEDLLAYDEAALRVATVRWAEESAPAAKGLSVELAAGEPGQTCVRVKKATQKEPFQHCTYGVVWPSSIRVAPHETAVAMTVQPLPGWSELLVLHASPGAPANWIADTVTPATVDPELGYVELAGFSADGARLLLVRESRVSGPVGAPRTTPPRIQRSFQVVATDSLRVEKQAASLANFPTFQKWKTADWQQGTLALR